MNGDTSYASVKMRPGRLSPSKLEIFLEVFGKWTENYVLPNVREKIVSAAKTHSPKAATAVEGTGLYTTTTVLLVSILRGGAISWA